MSNIRPDSFERITTKELAQKFINSHSCASGTFRQDDVYITENIHDAINKAFEVADSDDIICALGSLYMYKDIKGELQND